MPIIQNWFVSGLLAAVFYGAMILVYKKLLLMGVKPLVLNFFLFGLVFLGFFIWNAIEKSDLYAVTPKMFLFFAIAAIFSLFANFFDVNAIKMAPNPGYATTLKSCQFVLVALLAPILFHSSLGVYSFAGILCVIFGIFLIGK
ncbi:MAG: EamA family transporter [Candidatus Pacebacteria bacterium]|jgi:uncharacterized membrane protein|nr:EamA family transporter [Candidatus Paceibacterota bacterium]